MLAEGTPRDEAELEVALRAVRRWGIESAVVPGDLPVALADRLREGGIGVEVDGSRSRRAAGSSRRRSSRASAAPSARPSGAWPPPRR